MSEESLEEAMLDTVIEGYQSIVNRLKELRKAWGELPQATRAHMGTVPGINLEELEKLPWTTWKKDEEGNRTPAKPGEPGWVKNPAYFTSLETPPIQLELVEAIKKAGGKLELGGYTFSFSGKDEMFVTRRPRK